MIRFSKLAALATAGITAIALAAFSLAPAVSADSPGQLAGGSGVLVVKNVTKNGAYASSASAACNEEVQYSVRLHNAAFGGLTNVQVKANLANGSVTAVPAEGASAGTSGSVNVSVASGGTLAYENGSTQLFNASGAVIKNLPDTITGNGVNIGNINGSTTEFVNFKAKVNCPVTPPPTPKVKFACVGLDVKQIDRTHFDFTARASVENAAVKSYSFTAMNSKGTTVDNNTVTTNALSAVYHFNQSAADTYTVNAVVNTDHGSTNPSVCQQKVTVKAETPTPTPTPTPPVVKGETTPPAEIPNTGAGEVLGLFAGASAAGTAAHAAVRRFRK
jgi:hypothetical protein